MSLLDSGNWLSGQTATAIDEATRAIRAKRRIDRDPVTLTIVRNGGVNPAAQTVRFVMDGRTAPQILDGGEGVTGSRRDGILFGIRNHPTADDTDVQRGDLFRLDGQLYMVEAVTYLPGEVQANIVRNE
ncbi:MAG: hypothetical protein AAGK74_00120 [Chloroflexota bacterium]